MRYNYFIKDMRFISLLLLLFLYPIVGYAFPSGCITVDESIQLGQDYNIRVGQIWYKAVADYIWVAQNPTTNGVACFDSGYGLFLFIPPS
jgi:hypothetical protein